MPGHTFLFALQEQSVLHILITLPRINRQVIAHPKSFRITFLLLIVISICLCTSVSARPILDLGGDDDTDDTRKQLKN